MPDIQTLLSKAHSLAISVYLYTNTKTSVGNTSDKYYDSTMKIFWCNIVPLLYTKKYSLHKTAFCLRDDFLEPRPVRLNFFLVPPQTDPFQSFSGPSQ